MKIAAIIAEYNPFHNGHAYHIEETKKKTGADCIIVMMSGDFVQRGGPAVFDKSIRTRSALLCGADLVIELPSYYSTASAEWFAEGAIRLLNALSCVDYLSFGSESGDIEKLTAIASVLAEESNSYQLHLKKALKEGYPFAKARSIALEEEIGPEISDLLASPNNILAIEYLKALIRTRSSIQPITILRKGCGYHDITASEYPSASALRHQFANEDFSLTGVPEDSAAQYHSALLRNQFLCEDDFSLLLNQKIYAADNFTDILDVSQEISDRILNNRVGFPSYTDWILRLKTKQYSYTRISRCLIHILLDIKKEDIPERISSSEPYVQILGLRKNSPITKALKHSLIPVIMNHKQIVSLPPETRTILCKEQKRRNLYRLCMHHKCAAELEEDIRQFPVFIE